MSLTPTQFEILAIEREWLNRVDRGGKSTVIRERTGLSETRYYLLLSRLLDDADAIAAEPVLVGAVRRRMVSRRASSSSTRPSAALSRP